MAKLSAHGSTIGTIEYLTKSKRYMSDGKVLINFGDGWKVYGAIRTGFTPAQVYQAVLEKQNARLSERPAYAQYRKLLHEAAGLSKRWKLHAAIGSMPQDPDGVWSEACDGYGENCSCDIAEVVALCRAYQAAEEERLRLPS